MTERETILEEALRDARGMLDIVSGCSSHACVDCREYAGIHRDRIDTVLRKPLTDHTHESVTEVVDGADF